MNKTISTIISIALIVAGAVICYFCKFELAQITGFAMTMFGAGLAVANLWESRNRIKSNSSFSCKGKCSHTCC